MYLLGSFTAESNCKPLEMIATKNLANAPPCLQRMLLELPSNMGPGPRCNSLMHWANKSLTGDQAECKNWLHRLHKAMDWEDRRHNTERAHPGNSVPTHSARLATSKETCDTCSKMILGLQRWTFYEWWTTSERTKVGDTAQTLYTLSIWRPSLYFQGTGECKTTHVLARNQCWHWGLHKEMPGVHQAVSGSQGAFPASRHTRETIEENWHWLLQL